MIKHTREKQVKIVATGLALCMLAAPLSASAAESSVLMASGGVASVLETERTLEEYIQIAQQLLRELPGAIPISVWPMWNPVI